MKRALFVTVAANEIYTPVRAWRNSMGPCAHITYNAVGPPNDDAILACAKGYQPDVIFYIGAADGAGVPQPETLKALRDVAPSVLYQSDVEDEIWHEPLREYRRRGCFDLIVSQCGVKTDLVDMATLIAVDIEAFVGDAAKNRVCGFSGSYRDFTEFDDGLDTRAALLRDLAGKMHFRQREPVGEYRGYTEFLKKCLIVFNVSLTGSGQRHHVKWRVLEAAFADCALLEMRDSPTKDWFPEGSFFTYASAGDAKRLLTHVRTPEIDRMQKQFSTYAREHYTPDKIYGGILEMLSK